MKKIISIACGLLFIASVTWAQNIKGNYRILEGKIPPEAGSLDKVKVVEVFSFTCPHCYSFQKQLDGFQKKYGDKLEISHIPIGYGGVNPSKLYFIALENDKGPAIKKLIFQSFHDSGIRDINRLETLSVLAKIGGLEKEFKENKDNEAILDRVKFSKIFASSRKIARTPTFVVENSILVEGADVGNLSLILDSLLKKE
jgi:thiol:disulfide interchange protein DsbA